MKKILSIKNTCLLLFLVPFTFYCMDDENNSNPYSLYSSKNRELKDTQDKKERKKKFKQKLRNVLNTHNKAKLQIANLIKVRTNPSLSEFNKKKQDKIKREINLEIARLIYEYDYELQLPQKIFNFWPFEGKLDKESLKKKYDEETIEALHEHIIEVIKWNGEKRIQQACQRDGRTRNGSLLTDVLKLLTSDNILFLLEKQPDYIPLIFNPIIKNNSLENVPPISSQGNNYQVLEFYISDVKSQIVAQIESGIIQPDGIASDSELTTHDPDTMYKREIFTSDEIDRIKSMTPSSKKSLKEQTLVDRCKNSLKSHIEQQLLKNNLSSKSKDFLMHIANTYCINDWLREWDAKTEPKNIFSRKTVINPEQIIFKLALNNAAKNSNVHKLKKLAKDPILKTFSQDHQAIIQGIIQKYSSPKKIAKFFLNNHIKPRIQSNKFFDGDLINKKYLEDLGYDKPAILTAIITKIEKHYVKNIIDPVLFSQKFKALIRQTKQEKNKAEPSILNISDHPELPTMTKKTQLALEIFRIQKLKKDAENTKKNNFDVASWEQTVSTENFNRVYKNHTIHFHTQPSPSEKRTYLQV